MSIKLLRELFYLDLIGDFVYDLYFADVELKVDSLSMIGA